MNYKTEKNDKLILLSEIQFNLFYSSCFHMENDMIKYARELVIVARFNNNNITLYKNVIRINRY